MSKQQQIEKHLISGQSITGLQAIDLFGVYRLSSVINRLRAKDISIETSMIFSSDGKTLFAIYWIPINKR